MPADGAPRKVVDALKRQLRQHDLPRLLQHDGAQRSLFNLLRTSQGQHRLPQGLLQRVTQTCQRHGVPYAVIDRRTVASCAPLRCGLSLSDEQRKAVLRLLACESGVLAAGTEDDRWAVTAELIARRQQRTLILVDDRATAARCVTALAGALGLDPRTELALLDGTAAAQDEQRVTVALYGALTRLPREALVGRYGMAVFGGLHAVDPARLMRAVRGVDARYLLGLARDAVRADSLGEPLFLVLGGVVHRLAGGSGEQALRLVSRTRQTDFEFPYPGRAQYQALIAALARDERRNALIAADIAHEAAAGQGSLVLSERRDHLEALAALLPPGLTVAQVTSAVRPADRRRAVARFDRGELNVLLCTSQIAQELVRTPRVSRIFVTFPFSYARRLERLVALLLQPAAGKRDAVVYDYDDALIVPLRRACAKRAELLRRLAREAERAYQKWAQLSLDL